MTLLKELFCQAIEKPPQDRDSWLTARCREICAELHEELRELLACHAAAGSFLSDPTIDRRILRDAHPRGDRWKDL